MTETDYVDPFKAFVCPCHFCFKAEATACLKDVIPSCDLSIGVCQPCADKFNAAEAVREAESRLRIAKEYEALAKIAGISAVIREREACAKLAEEDAFAVEGAGIAAVIRKRGD